MSRYGITAGIQEDGFQSLKGFTNECHKFVDSEGREITQFQSLKGFTNECHIVSFTIR